MDFYIGVLVTTYNDGEIINRCLKSIYNQSYENMYIICIDDGSKVKAEDYIDFEYSSERMNIKYIEHSERAIARDIGINILKEKGVDYFIFLDSDMKLPENFIKETVGFIENTETDGVIFPEKSFSEYTNYWTKVKVFERNLYQVHFKNYSSTSIEAARLWKMSSFLGFEKNLNAFEEIQPTLRAIKAGKKVERIKDTFILHDEKHITLSNLISKKSKYFGYMGNHEAVSLSTVLTRFYFFRPQLYHFKNLLKYIKHPLKFIGVVSMYIVLSFIAFKNMFIGIGGAEQYGN